MSSLIIAFQTADIPGISRADITMLSVQERLEILVSDILRSKDTDCDTKARPTFYDDNCNFIDHCFWDGVSCKKTEAGIEFVDDITWESEEWMQEAEVFDFALLPRTLRFLDVSNNAISCTIALKMLPLPIEWVFLHDNLFFGTTNLADIPPGVQEITLSGNVFSGSLILQDLPPRMHTFDAHNNNYTGEIRLDRLPEALRYINLARNSLSGKISRESCANHLNLIDLRENDLIVANKRSLPVNILV